jgi:hypothetical protein
MSSLDSSDVWNPLPIKDPVLDPNNAQREESERERREREERIRQQEEQERQRRERRGADGSRPNLI